MTAGGGPELVTSRDSTPSRPKNTLLVLALCGAMLSSTLPQYALGVLAPVLSTELGMAAAEFGMLAASMYLLAAAISRAAGRRVDAMRERAGFLLIFGSSSAALLLVAGSVNRWWVLVAVLAAGMGMGISNSVTNRIIATSVSDGAQSLAIGIKQIGVKLAHVTAGAALPLLVTAVGWRWAVAALALTAVGLGVVGVGAVVNGSRLPPRPSVGKEFLVPLRPYRLYAFTMAVGMSVVTTYLPLYAVRDLGLSLQRAGGVVVAFAAAATVSRLFWAAAGRRMKSPRVSLCLLSAGGAAGLVVIAVAPDLGQWAIWSGALLGGATLGAWNVVVQFSVIRVTGSARAATGTGIVQSSFLLGLAAGSPAFAAVNLLTGSFPAAWLACAGSAAVAFGIAMMADQFARRLDGARVISAVEPRVTVAGLVRRVGRAVLPRS